MDLAAAIGTHPLDHLGDLSFVGHVDTHRERPAAARRDPCGNLPRALLVHVGDCHGRALLRKGLGDPTADPARCTGDDRDPAFQLTHVTSVDSCGGASRRPHPRAHADDLVKSWKRTLFDV